MSVLLFSMSVYVDFMSIFIIDFLDLPDSIFYSMSECRFSFYFIEKKILKK